MLNITPEIKRLCNNSGIVANVNTGRVYLLTTGNSEIRSFVHP
jgi:hypothetical protein